ncbi:sialate O-acetylesterase [Pedobacter psychroterrae]|uniref:Sialate O-acetylesterase n=1 Tax=Pedobacter psychroterrae TaxID=2530453 RepID=A0A4R0NG48_9SPHI|nr:sialate O-acetylesterase [Pedobacter psychroterrae]TCC98202.1 sialate O-acetylesterase [Pedobacter psychroterrae]
MQTSRIKKISLFISLLNFSVVLSGYAQVVLPDIISSHMVLKQKSAVPLWGMEQPGRKISILTGWDKKNYQTVADAGGNWKVMVNTPAAGGPYDLTIIGKDSVKLTDVLLGEVWISSGQSNMAFRLRQDSQWNTTQLQVDHPQIRLFKPKRAISRKEMHSYSAKESKWEISTAESLGEFSAMTYYFAVELQKKLKVPVGIINVSWGGVSIESWLPGSTLSEDPVLQNSVARWKQWTAAYEADSIKYTKAVQEYAKTKKGSKPKVPQSMYMMRRPHRQHGVLYNGMTATVTPFALSGMLWYQGTSSVAWAEEYELQLTALITSWRGAFDQPNLPVIVGQLTAFTYEDEAKAYQLRDAQLRQSLLNNVYVVCNMDLGNLDDVHPTNKQPYGLRFAGMALNQVYGKKNIAAFCPAFKYIKARGNRFFIGFDHAKGLHIKDGPMEEVYIAGADGKFVQAEAKIVKSELEVFHPSISQPKHVRYLYRNTIQVQLYNGDNLPAFPFSVNYKK